jgi:hypothetical protein
MRIIAFDGDSELEDIASMAIVIKAVPFENAFVPAFFIQSPDDDHDMSLDELSALMDGIEIAQKSIDSIIAFILKQSYKESDNKYKNYEIGSEEDDL